MKTKLIYSVLGLLLSACNPLGSNTQIGVEKNNADTTSSLTPTKEDTAHVKIDDYKIDSIQRLITLFKEKNIDQIADKIVFPLKREYPIPSIKNKNEFKRRFTEVFDPTMIDKIANSQIHQWSDVGWRGIMFDNGLLWMANSDGMISAVNYQSAFEQKQIKDLLEQQKENLHVSLKTFESAVYSIKTDNYLIRIDKLSKDTYRFASWQKDRTEASKPDIILKNGQLEFQGSGGNHVITFVYGKNKYHINRTIIGDEDTADITFVVENNGQQIVNEEGQIIQK